MEKKAFSESEPFLTAILDRYENDQAVLKFNDGQSLNVNKDLLFSNYKEGDLVILFFSKDKDLQIARENLAKNILDTLLKKSN